jgi:hypothetical protein
MVFIYVLQLEDKKFYIGKTDNPQFRLNSHFNYNGSAWTKKYKPIKVLKLIPDCDNYDEDKYTKIYMEKKGINNVRGGTHCKITLDINEIEELKKEINGATDCCYICGNNQHFANDCDKLTKHLNALSLNNFISAKKFEGEKFGYLFKYGIKGLGYYKDEYISSLTASNKDTCFRCHRIGHFANNCYATKDINGNYIQDEESDEEIIEVWSCYYCNKEFETEKGANYHAQFYCKKKYNTRNNSRNFNRCYYY